MIKLNGIQIPSFVKVNKVQFSALPPMENNLLKVRGKAGLYHMGTNYGQRVFTVSVTIIAEKINGVMAATRTFAEWLHYKEPVKLVFDDEPEKYYMVVPDGETAIDEIVSIGQGEITFIAVEPFAYGLEATLDFTAEQSEIELGVGGTVETYPEIELTMVADSTHISIVSDDGFVLIGEPETIEEKPVDPLPMVKAFTMSEVSQWTSPIMIHDGSGVKTAELETNGWTTGQFSGNYGEGAGWHGASGVQSLPKPLSNFEINMNFGFIINNYNQIGEIEVMMFDENNNQVGRFSFGDYGTSAPNQTFKVRAGKYAGGNEFINATHTGGVWMNMDSDGNFGRITIGKDGNHWWGYIARYNSKTGIMQEQHREDWYDPIGTNSNIKLSKIQLSFLVNGTTPPPQWMYVSALWVHERLTLGASEVPIIAKKEDVFLIDNAKGILYKNGEPFYEGLNPASNFIKLEKGYNVLNVVPSNKADVRIKYTERWL